MDRHQRGSCISNICMKLSFEDRKMSIRRFSRGGISVAITGAPSRRSRLARERLLRGGSDGKTVRPNQEFLKETGEGASHGFHDVGAAEGMARPGAVFHDQARSARG